MDDCLIGAAPGRPSSKMARAQMVTYGNGTGLMLNALLFAAESAISRFVLRSAHAKALKPKAIYLADSFNPVAPSRVIIS